MVSFSNKAVCSALVFCLFIQMGTAVTTFWMDDNIKFGWNFDSSRAGFSVKPNEEFQIAMANRYPSKWSLSANSDDVVIKETNLNRGQQDFSVIIPREGAYQLTSTLTDSSGQNKSITRDVWAVESTPKQYYFGNPTLTEGDIEAVRLGSFVDRAFKEQFAVEDSVDIYVDHLSLPTTWISGMGSSSAVCGDWKTDVSEPKLSSKKLDVMSCTFKKRGWGGFYFKTNAPTEYHVVNLTRTEQDAHYHLFVDATVYGGYEPGKDE